MNRLDNYEVLNQLKYIDGITIIDNKGTILFTIKFNPRFHSEILEREEILGESLFSVFPTLNEKSSTLLNALKTSRPVIYTGRPSFIKDWIHCGTRNLITVS
ncbi:hypothetical protein ACFX4I_25245 [Peribacillus sp. YIM B13472]|uniref:hypothetical protein n=1 Tax=Peribacillus sp. YIM B13472 TaxID=3366297 RepID=UPI00366D8248